MNNFRKQTFQQLLKSSGVLTDTVQEALLPGKKTSFKAIGSVGPGTTVMIPENPVKPDGSVDMVFQIRGIAGGDIKSAAKIGVNAVIVSMERGGIGSLANTQAYGSPRVINEAVGKILSNLKQMYPGKNLHLGKLTISSFSGGGGATANLLVNRDQLTKGTQSPKFVFIDGLHTDLNSNTMKGIVDFANQVKSDPSAGELNIVHTAVKPSGYHSTTETADYILNQTGVKRQRVGEQSDGRQPVSMANSGGLKVIQLYDKEQPYMTKDPVSGQIKPNAPNSAGRQHINALQYGLENAIK